MKTCARCGHRVGWHTADADDACGLCPHSPCSGFVDSLPDYRNNCDCGHAMCRHGHDGRCYGKHMYDYAWKQCSCTRARHARRTITRRIVLPHGGCPAAGRCIEPVSREEKCR